MDPQLSSRDTIPTSLKLLMAITTTFDSPMTHSQWVMESQRDHMFHCYFTFYTPFNLRSTEVTTTHIFQKSKNFKIFAVNGTIWSF